MNPVRTLYGRRLTGQLVYWMSALGYSFNDTSTLNRIYAVYFLGFWLIWVLAVFALLASWVAQVLGAVPVVALPALLVSLAMAALVGWALAALWRASQRSPFIFTEEDAYLLCQTPLPRSPVALALFFSNWIERSVPFAAGSIIFCLASVEMRYAGPMTLERFGEYWRYSGQALAVLLPVGLALQALVWTAGAARLRAERDMPRLRWAAPAALALIGASALLPAWLGRAPVNFARPLLLWPVAAALTAGFTPGAPLAAWLLAVGLAAAAAALAVGALAYVSRRLSLGRAAQETASHASLLLARRYGRTDVADFLRLRQRLQGERPPSRWLALPGARALLAKDLLQTARGLRLPDVAGWLLAGGLAAAMFTATGLPLRLLFGGLWVLSVGQVTTRRLRGDLAHWWLLRLLPLPTRSVFIMEFALPWVLTVAAGWAGLLLVSLPLGYRLGAILLLPGAVGSLACAAGSDILRQARVRTLMVPSLAVENVPQVGLGGLLQGSASLVIPLLLLEVARQPGDTSLILLLAAALSAVFIARLNLEAMASAYRWMQ